MSMDLDLDDAAHGHPVAMQELRELKDERDALRAELDTERKHNEILRDSIDESRNAAEQYAQERDALRARIAELEVRAKFGVDYSTRLAQERDAFSNKLYGILTGEPDELVGFDMLLKIASEEKAEQAQLRARVAELEAELAEKADTMARNKNAFDAAMHERIDADKLVVATRRRVYARCAEIARTLDPDEDIAHAIARAIEAEAEKE